MAAKHHLEARQRYREIILYKSLAELRTEAARSFLGMLWWILEPILYMSVFYVIFGVLRQRSGTDFITFLLTGLVIWKWFSSTISQGSNAISANAGLLRQVYLPKHVFPYIAILTNFVKFIIVFCFFLVFLQLLDHTPNIYWTALPVLFGVQIILMVALSSLLAGLTPIFPDLKKIIPNVLTLLFFLSGIFFDIQRLPEAVQQWLRLNPMSTIINGYRSVFLYERWPEFGWLGLIGFASIIGYLVARKLIGHYDRIYPRILLR
jgi:lipopolysaccharide transport system permease protein